MGTGLFWVWLLALKQTATTPTDWSPVVAVADVLAELEWTGGNTVGTGTLGVASAIVAVWAVQEVNVLEVRHELCPPLPTATAAGWSLLIVVLNIHRKAKTDLLDVGEAGDCTSLCTCLCKHREQDCSEDCDDCDNHQKLDQRETVLIATH